MISEVTRKMFEAAISADAQLTQEERNRLRSAVNGTAQRQRMLTPKEAMELLGNVTRRTLYQYERRGLIHGVRHSQRHVRFLAAEVEKLAFEGMKQEA